LRPRPRAFPGPDGRTDRGPAARGPPGRRGPGDRAAPSHARRRPLALQHPRPGQPALGVARTGPRRRARRLPQLVGPRIGRADPPGRAAAARLPRLRLARADRGPLPGPGYDGRRDHRPGGDAPSPGPGRLRRADRGGNLLRPGLVEARPGRSPADRDRALLALRLSGTLRPLLVQHPHPRAHVLAVVAGDPAADDVAVDHAALIDEDPAADLEVEAAF